MRKASLKILLKTNINDLSPEELAKTIISDLSSIKLPSWKIKESPKKTRKQIRSEGLKKKYHKMMRKCIKIT